jgi:hypothetical protein
VNWNIPGNWVINEDFNRKYYKLKEAKLRPILGKARDGQTLEPSIELWQMPEDYELPNDRKEQTNTLHFLLWKTFQTAQKLLLRGRPQDWPALFYTLCLLMLTYQTFSSAEYLIPVLDAPSREFRKALKSLIRVFLHHCGSLHPLNADLNIGWYSLMVGGENLPFKHYTNMKSIWVECRTFSKTPCMISS